MLEVLRQRAELLMERRRQDVKDEAEEVNNNGESTYLWFPPPLTPSHSTHFLLHSSPPPLMPSSSHSLLLSCPPPLVPSSTHPPPPFSSPPLTLSSTHPLLHSPLLTASRHDMATMQQQARQMRAVEREGRRRRRRAKGLNGHQPGSVASTHYEGLSSDDELLETNRLNFISDIGTICGHRVGLEHVRPSDLSATCDHFLHTVDSTCYSSCDFCLFPPLCSPIQSSCHHRLVQSLKMLWRSSGNCH